MDRQPLSPRQPSFSARVRQHFGRRASGYRQHAPLQQALAWRLAHELTRQLAGRALPAPAGPARARARAGPCPGRALTCGLTGVAGGGA